MLDVLRLSTRSICMKMSKIISILLLGALVLASFNKVYSAAQENINSIDNMESIDYQHEDQFFAQIDRQDVEQLDDLSDLQYEESFVIRSDKSFTLLDDVTVNARYLIEHERPFNSDEFFRPLPLPIDYVEFHESKTEYPKPVVDNSSNFSELTIHYNISSSERITSTIEEDYIIKNIETELTNIEHGLFVEQTDEENVGLENHNDEYRDGATHSLAGSLYASKITSNSFILNIAFPSGGIINIPQLYVWDPLQNIWCLFHNTYNLQSGSYQISRLPQENIYKFIMYWLENGTFQKLKLIFYSNCNY